MPRKEGADARVQAGGEACTAFRALPCLPVRVVIPCAVPIAQSASRLNEDLKIELPLQGMGVEMAN